MKQKMTAAMIAVVTSLSFAGNGSVEGTVVEQKNGRPLPGMKVEISGESRSAVTDQSGSFRINGVVDGTVQLIVSGIGYKSDTVDVTITDGAVVRQNITLEEAIAQMMKVTASGHLEGQTRAYNIMKNSDNIRNVISSDYMGRFPDQNSAEALQRINGISVQRDQGEGRYVQIRGSQPNMTSVNINGMKVPAPEGDGRSVALDVVPADVLGAIEVHKAITPEMDGDAIAGSVDLQTKKATGKKLSLTATGALGYNDLLNQKEEGLTPMNGQASLAIGKRFGNEERFGIQAGGSYLRSNRGSDNNEFEWNQYKYNADGSAWDEDNDPDVGTVEKIHPEEMELRDYSLTRERIGANLTFDANLGENTSLYVSGLYNRFGDDENRLRSKFNMEADSMSGNTYYVEGAEIFEKDVKDRYEVQDIVAISAGTEININKVKLDVSAGYSFAQESEPERYNTDFVMDDETDYRFQYRLDDMDFPSLILTDDYYNSDLFMLKKIEVEDNITKDQNVEGALDVTVPFSSVIEVKAGAKGRLKQKERDNSFEEYKSENDPLMTEFVGSYNNPEFLNGNYTGAHRNFADREKIRDYLDAHKNDAAYFEHIDAENAELYVDNYAADYEATEKVGAGYLQGKFNFGKFSVLAGARGEYTGFIYNGYKVETSEDEETITVTKTAGDKSQIDILPMVHARHSFNDNANIRFAYTRTFARPNFYDLVPYEVVNKADEEKELGNPDLEMQFSNNFDLMGEYYFSSIGLLSAGMFYKGMSDFIYERTYTDSADGYEVVKPDNADEASVFGLEANYEMQFTFLPGFLSGLGLGANYTWTTSNAKVLDEDMAEREITLPGQSDHIVNAFLMYEMDYFNVKAAINYHSDFLNEVGTKAGEDKFYDKHFQLDVSAGVRPFKKVNLSLFAEFVNLTNEPLRYYTKVEGTEVAVQQEYYSWWSHFGVKYSF